VERKTPSKSIPWPAKEAPIIKIKKTSFKKAFSLRKEYSLLGGEQ
jgi:hypothetical protein